MRKMIFREAKKEDARQILDIYYDNSRELLRLEDINQMLIYDRELYGSDYKFLSEQNFINWFINRGSSHIYVADYRGKIVGFILFHLIGKIGHIEELHVRRNYRGMGIGSELLRIAENYLWINNCEIIYLESNVKSYQFFKKHKYIPINVEEQMYMNKVQYIDMVKDKSNLLSRYLVDAIRNINEGYYEEATSILNNIINELYNKGIRRYNYIEFLKLVAKYMKYVNLCYYAMDAPDEMSYIWSLHYIF